MAKSYVTQFTEYVSEQQDKLRNKLIEKKLSPSPNATLGSLVSSLDDLQESFGADKYERDPNFPDIDTMFDNDPLRAVNGGQYKACSYFIMQVDSNNIVGFKFTSSNGLGYYGEKVIVSDGTEYENQTSTWTHTVSENGIYIGRDGYKYCLLKIYRVEPYINTNTVSSFTYSYGAVEIIDDFLLGAVRISDSSAVSGYNGKPYGVLYYRWVGSNVTPSNLTNFSISGTNYVGFSTKHIRFDGNFFLSSFNTFRSLQKAVFNGQNINPSTGNFTFGSSSGYSSMASLDYIKPPYNEVAGKFQVVTPTKEIFITDNYNDFATSYTSSGNNLTNSSTYLEKLHIGNGLEKWNTYSSYYYNLKEITTSQNIFGKNTSAVTINLTNSHKLTKQSVLNLFNGVADRTGMTANIITLSPFVKSFLTDEEKAILTNKNWTLS